MEAIMTAERVTIYMVTVGEYDCRSEVCAFVREQDAKEACAQGMGDNIDELRLYPAGQLPVKRTLYWQAYACVAKALPRADKPPVVTEIEGWDFEEIHSGPPDVLVHTGEGINVAWTRVRAATREAALTECTKQYEKLLKLRESNTRRFLGDRNPFDAR